MKKSTRRPQSTQQRMMAGPPVPPVYPCADCATRPVAHDGGRCVRCASAAWHAAHPVPEAWAPGVA